MRMEYETVMTEQRVAQHILRIAEEARVLTYGRDGNLRTDGAEAPAAWRRDRRRGADATLSHGTARLRVQPAVSQHPPTTIQGPKHATLQ